MAKAPQVASREVFDAIVVGSGITGGWAAKELTEKGLKTLLLERGPMVEHGTDYSGEHKAPWDLPYRGFGDRKMYEEEYAIQSTCYAFGEASRQFFVNDRENPYIQPADKPFRWLRGYHLGGRSLTWGRQCYRWSDLDFEANQVDGWGVDWPIRYRDIAPWYDYVESFAGISGQEEGLSQLPDGVFLPPMELNWAERQTAERIADAFPDRRMTIGRTAVLTRPHNGRAACHYCGPCHRGCSAGAYFSSLSATLPAALATGNLTIRCDSIVHSLILDPDRDLVSGVRVIDRNTQEALQFGGRLIFLCASTLGTTQILLNSTSTRYPTGLGNSSDALGRYLMDHHYEVGCVATLPGGEERYDRGNRPNGFYLARFRNLKGSRQEDGYVRGYGFQGSCYREGWQSLSDSGGIGADLKQRLRDPGKWKIWIGAWCEMLPYEDNRVALDADETDQWGIPLLRIDCTFRENEAAMRRDVLDATAEMLDAAGYVDIQPFDDDVPPGFCIHEMGTARMGRDPRTSVLNGNNQIHEVPNVFVTDGSSMASSACQNPSLTYMALTTRACDYVVKAVNRGDLRV